MYDRSHWELGEGLMSCRQLKTTMHFRTVTVGDKCDIHVFMSWVCPKSTYSVEALSLHLKVSSPTIARVR